MPDINDKFVLYYAVRGYRTGQTPTISIYDTVGSLEVNAQNMTELEATGIYTFNFIPRKRTVYCAVKDCAAFPRQEHEVIRVEKVKLSGAITFPKVHVPAPSLDPKEKEILFSKLNEISKLSGILPETLTEELTSLSNRIISSQDSIKKGFPKPKDNKDILDLLRSQGENLQTDLISNIRENLAKINIKLNKKFLDIQTDSKTLNRQITNLSNEQSKTEEIKSLHSKITALSKDISQLIEEKIKKEEVKIKKQPPVMDLLEKKKPYKFVIQEHQRGESSHMDFRLEINNHLIGFTLDDPGKVGEKKRFSNDPKISTKNKVLCQLKSRQPKDWLTEEGIIKAGEVGATKHLPARFIIRDNGDYEMGTQKPHFLEVFLKGKEFQGRFVFRKLPRSGECEKAGKKNLVWFTWKPIDQTPYVLSTKSIGAGWTPPKGKSALPKEWEDKIPSELQWWEKGWTEEKALGLIKKTRDILLKRKIIPGNKFHELSLPKSKKLQSIELSEWQIGSIFNLSKDKNLSLQGIASEIGCSKSSVIVWQKKLNLR